MQRKNWIYKQLNIDSENLKKLSGSPIIATLLQNRGIYSQEEAKAYFSKPLASIHSPFLFDGMEDACKRIISAISNNEKIVVYGDYDVDGITSTALLYRFLKSQNANVSYYIPTRADEGYGINILALNKIAKAGTKLLITVDCGITAVGEVEFAKLQGIDTILTDHHNCQEKIPGALAVINPKLPDSDYPFSGLAGVGVAFKLALAIASKLSLKTSEVFSQYSDLAAIGTIADLVPLTDENRIIVDRGLKKIISGSSFPGICAMLKICKTEPENVTSDTIAFSIAPRLNASGRLNSASHSVELLLTDDYKKAEEIAIELDAENLERRNTEQEIFSQALDIIENDTEFNKKKVIVLNNEGWHQGVIGIVASRICEKFYKPAIMISTEGIKGKGSGRSIPAFNLFNALEDASEHLSSFGGHSVAAGLNIKSSDIEAFKKHINAYADTCLTEEDFLPTLKIDCEIPAKSVNLTNVRFLSNFEPFGMGNETPVFSMHGVELKSFSLIGADKKHLRLTILSDVLQFNCIGFNMRDFEKILVPGMHYNIAFTLGINTYQGKELIQLRLKDIQTL